MKVRLRDIYSLILKNKFITVCILFTVFTMLDSIPILMGWYPPKQGIDAYVHLIGRFTLHSILIMGLWAYDILKDKFKSGLITYAVVFFVTLLLLFLYLFINGLVTELHPNAYYYAARSYGAMYLIIGIVVFIASRFKTTSLDATE